MLTTTGSTLQGGGASLAAGAADSRGASPYAKPPLDAVPALLKPALLLPVGRMPPPPVPPNPPLTASAPVAAKRIASADTDETAFIAWFASRTRPAAHRQAPAARTSRRRSPARGSSRRIAPRTAAGPQPSGR